ncbi:hypothetical protein IX307_000801 [Bacteroides pyogenes]|nr:hypothetical protein [Bacteroides pyogenes]MBR8719480.1 hypothetical protein [Bacteroides pyogenes]MBR8725694.1 hypothetical protein [Bacteroides pyogenes]MBR8738954.1 hypothetical protein [Bacteroides pyogenes]MBR8754747.1 hypothetical protein [Bacteroides pyogenes]
MSSEGKQPAFYYPYFRHDLPDCRLLVWQLQSLIYLTLLERWDNVKYCKTTSRNIDVGNIMDGGYFPFLFGGSC